MQWTSTDRVSTASLQLIGCSAFECSGMRLLPLYHTFLWTRCNLVHHDWQFLMFVPRYSALCWRVRRRSLHRRVQLSRPWLPTTVFKGVRIERGDLFLNTLRTQNAIVFAHFAICCIRSSPWTVTRETHSNMFHVLHEFYDMPVWKLV